ncbi:transcription antitermination factor NusB [Helicobacter mesocricetorum]|uniref:transcription antitermination factor NusB n=1 Tax=Helicobacter mesocricetorum TaxID=87012 RepID=UPI000CF071A3|nr:transcription antitermination factor NusB [Helicobacter mesocricetorum]
MATRSQARGVVIQLLYAYGSGNDKIEDFIEEVLQEQKIKNTQKQFAMNLFFGAIKYLREIDLRITHQLKEWDFSRVGEMEKAILRLGVYEIVYTLTDKAIVINEALEIAKNFCNDNSTKFVNGVLDGICKNLQMPLEEIEKNICPKD